MLHYPRYLLGLLTPSVGIATAFRRGTVPQSCDSATGGDGEGTVTHIFVDSAAPDRERREALYRGHLFVYSPKLIASLMSELGNDPDDIYFDVPRLRSSTAKGYLTTGIAYAFHPHRDTWYS